MARATATPAREPRWRRLDADERRAQILDCARRLFTEHSYADVSMAEIAARAGVRRGLLHHYFGNKHDLYVEVVRDLLARFGDLVDDAPAGGPVPQGRHQDTRRPAPDDDPAAFAELVGGYVDRWLDLVEQQATAWFALVDAESASRDPEIVALVQRAKGAMVDGVIAALGRREGTPEVHAVLRSYSGLAEVATREWLKRGNLDRRQAHALLTTALVAMLRDVTPAVEAASPVSRRGGRRPASRARAAGA